MGEHFYHLESKKYELKIPLSEMDKIIQVIYDLSKDHKINVELIRKENDR